jgi:hypothetical protein
MDVDPPRMPMRDGQMAGVAHMADLLVCVGGTGTTTLFASRLEKLRARSTSAAGARADASFVRRKNGNQP